MPSFCRHNRFAANCPICSREQAETEGPRQTGLRSSGGHVTRRRVPSTHPTRRASTGGMRVRRVARAQDDGFRSSLVPGIRSTADAERLAEEIGFAAARMATLATEPPGLYAEVAAEPDREEATWLAFLIAYLGPLDDEDPFAGIRAARTPWASGELPDLADVPLGPRTAHQPARGTATLEAYRAWAQRAGSQDAAFTGEAAWTPQRRFARVLERLAMRGLSRDVRYDLLVTLGQLGLYDMSAGALMLDGRGNVLEDTTTAAKRVFGIGDPLLLERRAQDLAEASGVPLATLDVGLWSWARPPRADRATLGMPDGEPDADTYAGVASALRI